MADAPGRDAGSDARHLVNRRAGEHGGDGRGGRGVADAHFPGGKQGCALGRLLAGHVDAHLYAGQRLFTGHGRAFAEVAGRVHDLAPYKALHIAEVALHAHVHDGKPRPGIAAEGVYRPAALDEIAYLHFRHFLPRGAHAPKGDVVISREQHYGLFGKGRAFVPGDPREPYRQFLKPAEAPRNLGEVVQTPLRRFRRPCRKRGDRQCVHGPSSPTDGLYKLNMPIRNTSNSVKTMTECHMSRTASTM